MRLFVALACVVVVGCADGKPTGSVSAPIAPTSGVPATTQGQFADEQRLLFERSKSRLLDQKFDNDEDFAEAIKAMQGAKDNGLPVLQKAADVFAEDVDQTDMTKNRTLADKCLLRYRMILEALPAGKVGEQHASRLVKRTLPYMEERIVNKQANKNIPDIAFFAQLGPKAKDALPLLTTIRDNPASSEQVAMTALKAIKAIEPKN